MVEARVLVVEDELSLRYVLSSVLGGMGCAVTCAASAEEALPLLEGESFALAMLDIVMPGMNGLELLGILRERSPGTEVIIMTSHASLETAVDAIRKGAYDYLHKPFEIDEVIATAERALEKRRLVVHNRELLATTERQNGELAAAVQRLAALNAAGTGFSGCASVQAVLDLFLQVLDEAFGADRVSVMMRNADEDFLHIVAARGLGAEIIRDTRVRRGEGVAGRVFETGALILVDDAAADPRTQAAARADLSPSFMSAPILLSVPIRSLDRIVGVVNVTNRRSGGGFDRLDAEFLAGLSGQLAVAIERARQTDQLRDSVHILKVAQERLIASERLNALGEMAAGVAHDFNNILNGVLGRAQLTLASAARGDLQPVQLNDSLRAIQTLAHQGADAVKRIQESAHVRKAQPTDAVDVNAVVQLGLEVMRPLLSGQEGRAPIPIEVSCDLQAVPLITGNALELLQALSNLVFNAVEAMPDGGELRFRTRADGAWVQLEVTDTGVGMTEEVKAGLFLPFHTSKPHGSGLGLSIVHGLVARMGGTIGVTSSPGNGSTFRLRLPARAEPAASPVAPATTAREAPIRARVLVVDDEPYNRDFYVDCLALHGHTVRAAPDGSEALALFEREPHDLVLTDLTMPGMTGWELAAAIKERNPELPVIVLSGWGEQGNETRAGHAGVDLMLSKPIGVEELLGAVQQTLRAGSAKRCA